MEFNYGIILENWRRRSKRQVCKARKRTNLVSLNVGEEGKIVWKIVSRFKRYDSQKEFDCQWKRSSIKEIIALLESIKCYCVYSTDYGCVYVI